MDRLKWEQGSEATFGWRYPGDALPRGSVLVVNPGQHAVFVRGGQVAGSFGPGTYGIESDVLPVIGRVLAAPFGGQSPLTAEVWFISGLPKRDLRWGTPTPVAVMDPAFGVPVSVRGYGTWGARVVDPVAFLTTMLGAGASVEAEKVNRFFAAIVQQGFTLAVSRLLPTLDGGFLRLNTEVERLAAEMDARLAAELRPYGVVPVGTVVERVSVPDAELQAIQAILRRRLEVSTLADAPVSDGYRFLRMMDVLQNVSSRGATSELFLAGLALDPLRLGTRPDEGPPSSPSSPKVPSVSVEERLLTLGQLRSKALITDEEYAARRRAVLDSIG